MITLSIIFFFFSSRRRHTRYIGDWSSEVCSSDLIAFIANFSRSRGENLKHFLRNQESARLLRTAYFLEGQRREREQLSEIGRASCREGANVSGVGVGV